ncbi:hypothetical protein HOLleu_30874 [Holothuria leucospilota]|uniref:Uncharacterized protein n=1 Tax=Holothuria leucospilota TaxID=206669 RepID=A0A9Q1H067_HOLLE|nr:hypothetical protein HOLleu_30874 [Holothuria leucospilota]
MADLDVEENESNEKVTSFEFDVTKDHGLNSDSEDEHSEEEKEKDRSGPVKKKKKFKPWKKLRRIFKKERKFVVDGSQNDKDKSHEESVPSQLLEQDEEDNKLPVSTEEFILSTSSDSPTDRLDLTSEKDTRNGSSPSRQRTESDEGLPLSPDTPSLNFDLDVRPSSEERSAGETSIITADEEEQSLQTPNGHYQPTPSPRTSLRKNLDDSSVVFDSVSGTTVLNSDAAKHRISVKPSSRRPSSRYRSPPGTTGQAFDFDASSLSFASESFDEETEMEQKSAFSASYKYGPMSPSGGEANHISGILDQLIEESKEASLEGETNVVVEVSPSVFVKEETKDVEEQEQMEETEEKFTFKLPEDEKRIGGEDRESDKTETVKEIVAEKREDDKDESELKNEKNERTEDEEEKKKMELRTETLKVKETGDDYENVEEIHSGDNKKEETGGATLRISSTVENTSIEKMKKEEVREEETREEVKENTGKETDVMKPSPQPRKKVPPQTVPKVDLLNDTDVGRRRKDENKDNSNRTLSVKDRISRLQMNAQPVAPVAPIIRSPRSLVTKPKSHPVVSVKAEASVTSSGEKVDVPATGQLSPTKNTDPPPKKLPTQQTDTHTTNKEAHTTNKEEDLTELPVRGGVKALIMRFQENQSQFSSVQRQTGVVN